MMYVRTFVTGAALMVAPFAWAGEWIFGPSRDLSVAILGEVHDNPTHHSEKVRFLEGLQPRAVVFEMLTPEEAQTLSDVPRNPEAMVEAVAGFHWSNIADYAEVLSASDTIVGAALPRETVRAAFSQSAAEVFAGDPVLFGLTEPLPEDEAQTRAQLQFDAHCEAMPMKMMGGMIEAQRLRDAEFARVVLDALEMYGPPVMLITGNGHAREDWGVPSYLRRVAPDLMVMSIGFSEDGAIDGQFTYVLDAPAVDRPDPCAAFK